MTDKGVILWECPGCRDNHGVHTDPKYPNPLTGGLWTFNGDVHSPTFQPSVNVRYTYGDGRVEICHCFVRNGAIEFLTDCTHWLRGQTVPMLPWD